MSSRNVLCCGRPYARRTQAGMSACGGSRREGRTVAGRRHAVGAREARGERADALQADRETDLGDGAVGVAQQRGGALEAAREQVGVRRLAERATKLAAEVSPREAGGAGEVVDARAARSNGRRRDPSRAADGGRAEGRPCSVSIAVRITAMTRSHSASSDLVEEAENAPDTSIVLGDGNVEADRERLAPPTRARAPRTSARRCDGRQRARREAVLPGHHRVVATFVRRILRCPHGTATVTRPHR